jgi:hypothetical protein
MMIADFEHPKTANLSIIQLADHYKSLLTKCFCYLGVQ